MPRTNGWEELGPTDGWGRHRRDYYVKHDKPKRLLVRELCRHARRSLQAEHLKPDLALVEAKVPPRCPHRVKAAPSQSTFCRLFQRIDGREVERRASLDQ